MNVEKQIIVFTHDKSKKIKISDFMLLLGDQRDKFLFEGSKLSFIDEVKLSMELKILQNNLNRYLTCKNIELLIAYMQSSPYIFFEDEEFVKNFNLQKIS